MYGLAVLEDSDGEFYVTVEERGNFREDYYYKTWISGNLEGLTIKIGKKAYEKYKKEAEERYGYINWRNKFVPGTERKELEDLGTIEIDFEGYAKPYPGPPGLDEMQYYRNCDRLGIRRRSGPI